MRTLYVTVIFHPNPTSVVMRELPLCYQLSRAQLLCTASKMAGVPVTFEHLGIMRAAGSVRSLVDLNAASVSAALATTSTPEHRQIGIVLGAWEERNGAFSALLEIEAGLPGLHWLITSKQLAACSLTHVVGPNGLDAVPLEVSLVGVPARPGCIVTHISSGWFAATAYKARSFLEGKAFVAMSELVTKTQEAIHELPQESQELIMAKFGALVQSLEKEKANATAALEGKAAAEEALTSANKLHQTQQLRSDCDVGLLSAQIKQMIKNLPTDMLENYDIDSAKTIHEITSGDSTAITNGLGRLVMCANAFYMQTHRGGGARSLPMATGTTSEWLRSADNERVSAAPPTTAAGPMEPHLDMKRQRFAEPAAPPRSNEEALRFALNAVFD
jgi:hypothetical protein